MFYPGFLMLSGVYKKTSRMETYYFEVAIITLTVSYGNSKVDFLDFTSGGILFSEKLTFRAYHGVRNVSLLEYFG